MQGRIRSFANHCGRKRNPQALRHTRSCRTTRSRRVKMAVRKPLMSHEQRAEEAAAASADMSWNCDLHSSAPECNPSHRCPRDRVRTCQFFSARRLPREEEKDWRVISYGFGEPWRQGSARRICWPNSPHASRPIQRGPLHAIANCRLSALFLVDRFPQALPLIPKRREPNFRFLSALLPLTFSLY